MKHNMSIAMVLMGFAVHSEDIATTVQGGEFRLGHQDHTPEFVQQNRWLQYTNARAALIASGDLPQARRGIQPSFNIPLATTESYPGFYGISNYVDHLVAFPNSVEDWNCGTRTYDTQDGYNHQGTDFFTWPFDWHKMDNDEVQVVAAEAGEIVLKQDGQNDRSCDFNNNNWNAVYLEHADGSTTWYGHLKNGSLTNKSVGQSVAQGEYLGVVGSSGNSTGPHLHFEVYDNGGNLIDPFLGACNRLNNDSWWVNQNEYYDSQINQLATHDGPPEFPTCDTSTTRALNTRDHFLPGETVYVTAYYRDQRDVQLSNLRVYRPNGTVYWEEFHNSDAPHYAASYWYWGINLPANAEAGEWRFWVSYNQQTYEHSFYIGDLIFESDFN